MTYETLTGMEHEVRMNLIGKCGHRTMTLREYVEGGWLDANFNREEDFRFKDGGYIYVEKDDNGDEAAYFVDAENREEAFLMF